MSDAWLDIIREFVLGAYRWISCYSDSKTVIFFMVLDAFKGFVKQQRSNKPIVLPTTTGTLSPFLISNQKTMDNIHCKDEELFSNYHVLAVSLL
jgi:hypothetical protein